MKPVIRNIANCIQIETETDKQVRSENYNYNFDKKTGFFVRWGKTFKDDPAIAPFPEILDIEVSEICNGVPGLNGIEAPCKFCSPAGTLINTPSGMKSIEDIAVGDTVYSYNGVQVTTNEVVEVYEHSDADTLVLIELEDGSSIELTPDHEVFLVDGTLKCAGDIVEGDDVRKIN